MIMTIEKDWRLTLLPADSTIEQAIRNLVNSGQQIILVISPDGTLQGTITDGDIRRGLLRGMDLTSSIDEIVHRDPFVVPPQMEREVVQRLMRANRLSQLPVVDVDRRVVGLHLWDEVVIPAVRPNLMVVMAGGFGTRMRPHTENCPKPMLPIAGKPMLEHIVERAKGDGFERFVFAIHYLGKMIEEYFRDGSRWDVQIDYLREQEPLGTAGALGLLDPRPELPFVVSNGDVLTDIRYGDLLDFHVRHGAAATMAVRLYEWQHPYGVVKTNGLDITSFEEKPVVRTHVNAGIYVLEPVGLENMGKSERCDMPTLFGRLVNCGHRTVVYPMHEPWLDVGRPSEYEQAQVANSDGREQYE